MIMGWLKLGREGKLEKSGQILKQALPRLQVNSERAQKRGPGGRVGSPVQKERGLARKPKVHSSDSPPSRPFP